MTLSVSTTCSPSHRLISSAGAPRVPELTFPLAAGGIGYGYESSTTLHKELDLDLKGEVLEKGSHA